MYFACITVVRTGSSPATIGSKATTVQDRALVAVLFNYILDKLKVVDFEFAENREITATSEAKAKSMKGMLYRISHVTKRSHILETFSHIGYVC